MIRVVRRVRSTSARTGVVDPGRASTGSRVPATASPQADPRRTPSPAIPLLLPAPPTSRISSSTGGAAKRSATTVGFPVPGTAGCARARRSITTVPGVWNVRSFRIRAARPASSTTTRMGVADQDPARMVATTRVRACHLPAPVRLHPVRVANAYRRRASLPLLRVGVVRSNSRTGSPAACSGRDAGRLRVRRPTVGTCSPAGAGPATGQPTYMMGTPVWRRRAPTPQATRCVRLPGSCTTVSTTAASRSLARAGVIPPQAGASRLPRPVQQAVLLPHPPASPPSGTPAQCQASQPARRTCPGYVPSRRVSTATGSATPSGDRHT